MQQNNMKTKLFENQPLMWYEQHLCIVNDFTVYMKKNGCKVNTFIKQ